MKKNWSAQDIPSLKGKTAVVTGTGGLGYETALELAQHGAEVILAGRNKTKGEESVKKIKAAQPTGAISFQLLDLADLTSVKTFAKNFSTTHSKLDILVNNAGVMSPPKRKTTADGFELQMGTNYLGHYALTANLLPLLKKAPGARVINLSSIAHNQGTINFKDLQAEKKYKAWPAYGQSKLAMLIFAFELQKKSDAQGWGITSVASHPGYARTDLMANGPGTKSVLSQLSKFIQPIASQSAAEGALPTLFAATSPEAKGGTYYGPNWFFELKGAPKVARVSREGRDPKVAAKLWEVSQSLTHVQWS